MFEYTIEYIPIKGSPGAVRGGGGIMEGNTDPSPQHLSCLRSNPFVISEDSPVYKIGVVDGRVGGTAYIFPTRILADGKEVLAASGSELKVAAWARSSGLGFGMCDFAPDMSDGDHVVFEGGCISQIAVKVHRFMGYRIFEYPRLVMLLKTRAVVEMKIKNWLLKPISWIFDCCLWMYSHIVSLVGRIRAAGVKVVDVDASDDAQLAILGKMTEVKRCRFAEVHNEKWFKWVLSNSYSKDGPPKAYLIYKNDKPLGFFMVKKRFHEQASHRGFKNVWLGSVIEWGCLQGCERKLLWIIVLWVMKQRKKLDAVEFPVYEEFAQKFLRRLGWQHVGDANFCYRVRPNSSFQEPEGMNDPSNWRLRAGMGDCALN